MQSEFELKKWFWVKRLVFFMSQNPFSTEYLAFVHHVMYSCYLIVQCAGFLTAAGDWRRSWRFAACRPQLFVYQLTVASPPRPIHFLHYSKQSPVKNAEGSLYCRCIFDDHLWLPLTFMTNSFSHI